MSLEGCTDGKQISQVLSFWRPTDIGKRLQNFFGVPVVLIGVVGCFFPTFLYVPLARLAPVAYSCLMSLLCSSSSTYSSSVVLSYTVLANTEHTDYMHAILIASHIVSLEAVHHAPLHSLSLCLGATCNDLTHGSRFFFDCRCTNCCSADATEHHSSKVSMSRKWQIGMTHTETYRSNPILNTRPFVVPALIAANPSVIIYHIPFTRTTLYIRLADRLPIFGMSSTLLVAIDYVETHIDRHGDGWLSGHDDPFSCDQGLGVTVSVRSIQGQHMTYGILRSTLKGIRDFLLVNHRYVGAMFEVAERGIGMVGSGVVEASPRRE